MENSILSGVGKKLRIGYLNGTVTEIQVKKAYKRNQKEADSFSVYGYTEREIYQLLQKTHNPLLQEKLKECLDTKRENSKKSNIQNEINLSKLAAFKENACGVGLRKVIRRIKKEAKISHDRETKLVSLLLEIEFANLSAKQHTGILKRVIYERKSLLLYQISHYLEELGWKYGINDEAGKNASFILYVYLPNGIQLSWHCNEYGIYKCYPYIEAEWDGQACMTMEKILNFIEDNYFKLDKVA